MSALIAETLACFGRLTLSVSIRAPSGSGIKKGKIRCPRPNKHAAERLDPVLCALVATLTEVQKMAP